MNSILNILQNKTDFGKTDDKKEDVIITSDLSLLKAWSPYLVVVLLLLLTLSI